MLRFWPPCRLLKRRGQPWQSICSCRTAKATTTESTPQDKPQRTKQNKNDFKPFNEATKLIAAHSLNRSKPQLLHLTRVIYISVDSSQTLIQNLPGTPAIPLPKHLSYRKHPNIALLQALLWCQVFLQGFHILQVTASVQIITPLMTLTAGTPDDWM